MPRPKKTDYSALSVRDLKVEISQTVEKLKEMLDVLGGLNGIRQEALSILGQMSPAAGESYYSPPPNYHIPGAPAPSPVRGNLPSLQPVNPHLLDDMFESDLAIGILDPGADLTEQEFKGFEPVRPQPVEVQSESAGFSDS